MIRAALLGLALGIVAVFLLAMFPALPATSVILFAVQQLLLIGLYPMSAVLVVAALRRPYIAALTIMALSTVAITLGISAYQFAVTNAAAGYPVDPEVAKTILRGALILIEALPIVFFGLYFTGRFEDGTK